MDSKEIAGCDEVNPQQVKNIKCLLLGVNEKLKIFELFKDKCNGLNTQIFEEQKSRENMHLAFKKNCKDYLQYENKLNNTIKQLNERCKSLANRNLCLENIEKEFNDYKINKNIEIHELKAKIILLQNEKKFEKTTEDLVNSLYSTIKFKEEAGKIQNNEFKKIIQCFDTTISEYQKTLKDLVNENFDLSEKWEKFFKENAYLKEQNSILQTNFISIKAQLSEYQGKILNIKELEDQIKINEKSSTKLKENYSNSKLQLEKLSQRYHEGSKSLNNDKKLLIESNKRLSEENSFLKQKINDYQIANAELQNKLKYISSTTILELNNRSLGNFKLLEEVKFFSESCKKFDSERIQEFLILIAR